MTYGLSKFFADVDLSEVVMAVAGDDLAVETGTLFDVLPYDVAAPIESAILRRVRDATSAAFAAGVACGRRPELIMLCEKQ